ncbi:hypothetical protein [Natronocalculus amylovorans]|uniref:Uncharacterized protein n=1 Tax=Natronocalculus amylovorans TaxID=2917812 RepID=A0AAE3FVJ6_9EURY|nr:hypothetical protein [Natronocalculus amylovorans]MCL9816113.1 hypothetical protein [Natronocalculus amylovorans]
MYEQTYDTDWVSLSREESIERGFALGVATACGCPNEKEYQRLVASVETTYDQSIVELAFREGLAKGKDKYNNGMTSNQVWEMLVEPTVSAQETGYPGGEYLPGALGRTTLFDTQRGPPGLLEQPSFLTKD